jgi:hypothetical protein
MGRNRAHPDFFTEYIEKVAEYRVWAFRRNVKGLYQKVRRYEGGTRAAIVWNWENGYAFDYVPSENRTAQQLEICRIGAAAIDALDLDFGAADLIVDGRGRIVVLEVNTAPGVEGPRAGLTGLVDSIVRWHNNGFPRRNGEGRATSPFGEGTPATRELDRTASLRLQQEEAERRRRDAEETVRIERERQENAARLSAEQERQRRREVRATARQRVANLRNSRQELETQLNTLHNQIAEAEAALEELDEE